MHGIKYLLRKLLRIELQQHPKVHSQLRDDIQILLYSLLDLLNTKQNLLKKIEINMQTIQIYLLNENEETIENLIAINQQIIEEISLSNYSISNIVKIITLKIGVEYNEFEKFLLNLKHPIVNSILDNMDTINIITKRLSNLNETITILLKKHQDLILKNIHEINKIIELQYTISYLS
ncbi:MAG TPA: hypothetical protein PLE64_09610 [Spirochaetota bacterium]|nr:hypothetical protein [Spirochaetota bacterium]